MFRLRQWPSLVFRSAVRVVNLQRQRLSFSWFRIRNELKQAPAAVKLLRMQLLQPRCVSDVVDWGRNRAGSGSRCLHGCAPCGCSCTAAPTRHRGRRCIWPVGDVATSFADCLFSKNTGAHIWADRFERDMTDIFALQDDVTLAVISAIQPNRQKLH
jgi:hypothetical protein